MKKVFKTIITIILLISIIFIFIGCSNQEDKNQGKIIIYTNGDEEAIEAMESALNSEGYDDRYILQAYGTSELGGRIIAEGDSIDANIITMSSYFIESAQEKNNMFLDLTFDNNSLEDYPSYYAPILAITGSLF